MVIHAKCFLGNEEMQLRRFSNDADLGGRSMKFDPAVALVQTRKDLGWRILQFETPPPN